MTALPETTYLVWPCLQCRRTYKVQPEVFKPNCRCEKPVPALRPTVETQIHAPKSRPMHALSDEEGRLRALARKGTKVRVTFEGEITGAMQWSSAGRRGLEFTITTPDGRSFTVDPQRSDVHIEAAAQDDQETSA
ncbi:hypothetical protein OG900_33530 [Streptomyces sp. NBC_00433]